MKREGPSFSRWLFWRVAHRIERASCQECGVGGVELPATESRALCHSCRQRQLKNSLVHHLNKPPSSR